MDDIRRNGRGHPSAVQRTGNPRGLLLPEPRHDVPSRLGADRLRLLERHALVWTHTLALLLTHPVMVAAIRAGGSRVRRGKGLWHEDVVVRVLKLQ